MGHPRPTTRTPTRAVTSIYPSSHQPQGPVEGRVGPCVGFLCDTRKSTRNMTVKARVLNIPQEQASLTLVQNLYLKKASKNPKNEAPVLTPIQCESYSRPSCSPLCWPGAQHPLNRVAFVFRAKTQHLLGFDTWIRRLLRDAAFRTSPHAPATLTPRRNPAGTARGRRQRQAHTGRINQRQLLGQRLLTSNTCWRPCGVT